MAKRVPSNVRRALRLLKAAAAIVELEASWATRGSGQGAASAKRELILAVEDYVQKHASGNSAPLM